MAKETKDTTLQLRVSSDTLKKARDVFEQEGKTISKAVRAYLEETVRLGKTPFRVTEGKGKTRVLNLRKSPWVSPVR